MRGGQEVHRECRREEVQWYTYLRGRALGQPAVLIVLQSAPGLPLVWSQWLSQTGKCVVPSCAVHSSSS